MSEKLKIGKFEIENRLFVGTGKYATYDLMREALAASGCEVATTFLANTGMRLVA